MCLHPTKKLKEQKDFCKSKEKETKKETKKGKNLASGADPVQVFAVNLFAKLCLLKNSPGVLIPLFGN